MYLSLVAYLFILLLSYSIVLTDLYREITLYVPLLNSYKEYTIVSALCQ